MTKRVAPTLLNKNFDWTAQWYRAHNEKSNMLLEGMFDNDKSWLCLEKSTIITYLSYRYAYQVDLIYPYLVISQLPILNIQFCMKPKKKRTLPISNQNNRFYNEGNIVKEYMDNILLTIRLLLVNEVIPWTSRCICLCVVAIPDQWLTIRYPIVPLSFPFMYLLHDCVCEFHSVESRKPALLVTCL